jgi:predicted GIY-YIG superfamily endonuclease
LVYKEEYEDKGLAIKREREIKRMKSSKYIQTLIESKSTG